MEEYMKTFQLECRKYLRTLGISDLRAYARQIGVERPTTKNKDNLIDAIVGVLSGEIAPIPCSKLGAPVLNKHIDPNIPKTIERLHLLHVVQGSLANKSPFVDMIREMQASGNFMMRVSDPNESEYTPTGRKVHTGQLENINAVSMLLPLDCIESDRKILIPVEIVQDFSLQEGDVVDCYVGVGEKWDVATKVLAVNGIPIEEFHRNSFQSGEVCFPTERISMRTNMLATKFLQWTMPIGKGQRALLVSAPKAGKTYLLQEIAQALQDDREMETIAVLVDQSPETVSAYRKVVKKDNLLFTTYDHDPERQAFVAEFAIKRAKSLVESGKDVLLILDSFNALARAYNDTDLSMGGKMLPCGLESKTVQYLKKYFGSARCMEKGGSLTIVGAITTGTGNPADEYLTSELSALANWSLTLDEKLAYKRIYPAIDVEKARINGNDALISECERQILSSCCERGVEWALKILEESESFDEFVTKVLNN